MPTGFHGAVVAVVAALFLPATPLGAQSRGSAPPQAVVEGVRTLAFSFEENRRELTLGNRRVAYRFSKEKGGALVEMIPKAWEGSLHQKGEALLGRWLLDFRESGSHDGATLRYEGALCRFHADAVELTLRSSVPGGELIHRYRLGKDATSLKMSAWFENRAAGPALIQLARFRLNGVALHGSLEGNQYLYPPTWLHFPKGPLRGASAEAMNARYVYGGTQPTDKIMLPYAMLWHPESGESLALAAVQSEAKVYVGALQGEAPWEEAGMLEGSFALYRTVAPGERREIGTVYLSAWSGGWERAMAQERELLVREAGFRAPASLPASARDLVIVWHGVPGVEIDSFEELGRRFTALSEAGVNAVIVGGKLWNCPATGKGEGTILDYIPVPQEGAVVPAEDLGGREGLRQLIETTHRLGMKFFIWGPVSMAGIARQSPEAEAEPAWWIRKADGSFNDWYTFMAPANPHAEGWRRFVVENVRRVVRDYGVDGFWLDSTWQDHQLHELAPDGWIGGPNGDKMSLLEEIVSAARAENRECIVMAEGGGAEVMSRVDAAYLQVHGIWPTVPPEGIQELLIAQELNRLPGVRPFGQIELGLGFYADLKDPRARALAEEYRESWKAKSFLVGTLDRIPVYFGFSSQIDLLSMTERHASFSQETRDELAAFGQWFSKFGRLNRVRREHPELIEGATLFDLLEVSSPSVVQYVRHGGTACSLVLLNADHRPQSVVVKVRHPEGVGLDPARRYRVVNLMNEHLLAPDATQTTWLGADLIRKGVRLELEGYEGAILKIRPEPAETASDHPARRDVVRAVPVAQ
ncbi:MAG TPA: hypothetical protein VNQ90_08340 [Chthoniobacteraceae bacterium]|nr:hypothetical protein [Chthoniobacteraceae bacterium]